MFGGKVMGSAMFDRFVAPKLPSNPINNAIDSSTKKMGLGGWAQTKDRQLYSSGLGDTILQGQLSAVGLGGLGAECDPGRGGCERKQARDALARQQAGLAAQQMGGQGLGGPLGPGQTAASMAGQPLGAAGRPVVPLTAAQQFAQTREMSQVLQRGQAQQLGQADQMARAQQLAQSQQLAQVPLLGQQARLQRVDQYDTLREQEASNRLKQQQQAALMQVQKAEEQALRQRNVITPDDRKFTGMIGPTAVNYKNDKESAELERLQSEFARKSSAYALAHKQLMDKATTYITSGSRDKGKNFNMFVTRTPTSAEITKTAVGCYNYTPETGLLLQSDLGTRVSEDTCKLRASDLGQTVFGTRGITGQCYVSDDSEKAKAGGLAVMPITSYKLKQQASADVAQFFYNGQVGIYNSVNKDNLAPGNVTTDFTAAAGCDMFDGGTVNVQSASYGYNCNNTPDTRKTPAILYAGDTNYALNQPSGENTWGAQLDLKRRIDTNQKQNFIYDPATKHIRVNADSKTSNMCVNVHGSDVTKPNGGRIIQWGCQGPNDLNDQWTYDNQTKKFVSSLPGPKRCLDLSNKPGTNGQSNYLLLNDCNNVLAGNQQFSIFVPDNTPPPLPVIPPTLSPPAGAITYPSAAAPAAGGQPSVVPFMSAGATTAAPVAAPPVAAPVAAPPAPTPALAPPAPTVAPPAPTAAPPAPTVAPPAPTVAPPAPVSNLKAVFSLTPNSSGKNVNILLSWTNPTPPAWGIIKEIYQRPDGDGTSSFKGQLPGTFTSTEATLENKPGPVKCIVTTFNSAGTKGTPVEITATVLTPPTNLQMSFAPVHAEAKAKTTVTWTASVPAPESYTLTATGRSYNFTAQNIKTPSFVLPTKIPYGTPITVTVASVNANGESLPATVTNASPRHIVVKNTWSMNYLGNDIGSGMGNNAGWWRPSKVAVADGSNPSYVAYPVGDTMKADGGNNTMYAYNSPTAVKSVVVGGDVAPMASYNKMWGPMGSWGLNTERVTCPAGYVSMGDSIVNNNVYTQQTFGDMRCVPQDCVTANPAVNLVWPKGNAWGLYQTSNSPTSANNFFTQVPGALFNFNTTNTDKCNISYI